MDETARGMRQHVPSGPGRLWVVVGDRPDPGVAALARLAARAGLPVQLAALHPPQDASDAWPGAPSWHRLSSPDDGSTLTGALVRTLTRRLLRGPSAALTDALAADPWVAEQVDHADVELVGADDAATQALAAWAATRGGPPLRIHTWDRGSALLVEELEELARQVPLAAPGSTVGDPSVDPGAMIRVAVAVAPGRRGTEGLDEGVRAVRGRLVALEPGAPVPPGTDVLVLDGSGPAVAQLPDLGGARVLRIVHPRDRSDPWTRLVEGSCRPRGPAAELSAARVGEAGAGEEVLAEALVGPHVRALQRLRLAGEDGEALEAAARHLADGSTDPLLLREIVYLARVTGSPSVELRALTAQQHAEEGGGTAVERALHKVRDRLRETDVDWFPDLPHLQPGVVPGRILHLLKTTLPRRQAGYSVRGHHSLVALAARGLDVVAVQLPERVEPGAEAAVRTAVEEVRLDGVRYLLPPPVVAAGTAEHLEAAARALLPVVAAERPDLLHVHSGHRGYDLGVVGAALAGALGRPWVYEVRGLFESTWTADQARAERGELFARRSAREVDLVRRADATVTLARTMAEDLVARGAPADRLHVIPNAVDPEVLQPVPRDPDLVRTWAAGGRFTFGYVSNLDHDREQVEDLVRAAILLHASGTPTLALVVGTGRREGQLHRLVEELGAGGQVAFTGRVPHDRVADYYALLDVLVVPRGSERAGRLVTPLKPFEAMAMGVPLVVSDQPALLEVIGDGERGWSYPAGDAAALAELLGRLAADPEGRAEVADRALAWVTRQRTWAGNAERYRAVYAEVAAAAR